MQRQLQQQLLLQRQEEIASAKQQLSLQASEVRHSNKYRRYLERVHHEQRTQRTQSAGAPPQTLAEFRAAVREGTVAGSKGHQRTPAKVKAARSTTKVATAVKPARSPITTVMATPVRQNPADVRARVTPMSPEEDRLVRQLQTHEQSVSSDLFAFESKKAHERAGLELELERVRASTGLAAARTAGLAAVPNTIPLEDTFESITKSIASNIMEVINSSHGSQIVDHGISGSCMGAPMSHETANAMTGAPTPMEVRAPVRLSKDRTLRAERSKAARLRSANIRSPNTINEVSGSQAVPTTVIATMLNTSGSVMRPTPNELWTVSEYNEEEMSDAEVSRVVATYRPERNVASLLPRFQRRPIPLAPKMRVTGSPSGRLPEDPERRADVRNTDMTMQIDSVMSKPGRTENDCQARRGGWVPQQAFFECLRFYDDEHWSGNTHGEKGVPMHVETDVRTRLGLAVPDPDWQPLQLQRIWAPNPADLRRSPHKR